MIPIRDVVVAVGLLASLPVCFLRPWVGILVWFLLSFFGPHKQSWGFARDLPVAQAVAVAVLLGILAMRGRKPFPWTRESTLMVLLWGWFTVTSVFAFYPEAAWDKWLQFSKVILITLVAIPLFDTPAKLRWLMLVIAGSLGYFGLKGGIFSLLHGGQYTILGPESFIAANTEMALALNMTLPFLLYLAKDEPRRWLRWLLRLAFFMTMIAVPFTYSRGGLVGLAVVLALLFLKARYRLAILPVALAGVLLFWHYSPERFVTRTETLADVEADESANLRFMSWRVGYLISLDYPITGGGFRAFVSRATYDRYLPEYPRPFGHDGHSIYFNLLGEHGYVGLILFLILVASALATLWRLRRIAGRNPSLAWVPNYAHPLQVSIIAWLANGITLSASYFDLGWQLLGFVVILTTLVAAEVGEAAASAPALRGARAPRPLATRPAR